MPDFALCAGRPGADNVTPLRICADCRRRTTAPGVRQAYILPPVRRVGGTTRWQCDQYLQPEEITRERNADRTEV